MKNNAFEIQIVPHPRKPDWYVAKYQSGFLSATYSVEFAHRDHRSRRASPLR